MLFAACRGIQGHKIQAASKPGYFVQTSEINTRLCALTSEIALSAAPFDAASPTTELRGMASRPGTNATAFRRSATNAGSPSLFSKITAMAKLFEETGQKAERIPISGLMRQNGRCTERLARSALGNQDAKRPTHGIRQFTEVAYNLRQVTGHSVLRAVRAGLCFARDAMRAPRTKRSMA